MIPKIIHYCWFGKGKKPELIEKCIESWRKFCPDFEIIEWNEDNFEVDSNRFTKEAYSVKKWAFVSDYVRLFALQKFGGIYLDTDCELIKPISPFLDSDKVIIGYQDECTFSTAIILSPKGNPWIGKMLEYYNDRPFLIGGKTPDTTTNSSIMVCLSIKQFGFKLGDSSIEYGPVSLYESVVFAPSTKKKNDPLNGKDNTYLTDPEKTVCIHHCTATWKESSLSSKFRSFLINTFKFVFGYKNYAKLKKKEYMKRYKRIIRSWDSNVQ